MKDVRKNKEYFDIDLFNKQVWEQYGTESPSPSFGPIYTSKDVYSSAAPTEEDEE